MQRTLSRAVPPSTDSDISDDPPERPTPATELLLIHVTDLSGKETLARVTGGMKVKLDHDEATPYAAVLASQDVAQRCKELGITALHIKLLGMGGHENKPPGPGAHSAIGALARFGMKIGSIEDVTPRFQLTAQADLAGGEEEGA